ncbi:hypothetical protein VCHA50P417_10055 [Vibrio chagasii]|nr:hypothetical protein VCHA27O13_10575 [Vibrio chagasii]CAH6849355.1 hypothetical protein VCHA35O137_10547 [Vibrio chagasii]CAH7010699.1 hypothetical protein VCHA50P417_10055 [Vibrio chagasii]CAH7057057.1 hypothetical protein VCHA48P442_10055 [Vibrio chagasii]CAH7415359.1 hypothetical protein VCHA53O463_50197 [Vibrio chagasii]
MYGRYCANVCLGRSLKVPVCKQMHNWYEELMTGFVMLIREWWFIKLGSCGLILGLKCWKSVNKQGCT